MNTLELSNVELSAELKKKIADFGGGEAVHKLVDPVIRRLATLNPLWIFRGTDYTPSYSDGKSRLVVSDFSVHEAGEEIGRIGRSHHGNREVIAISNDRITKARFRAHAYRTVDADKAVLMAKKMFSRLKPTERVEKALNNAGNVINQQKRLKDREKYTAESAVRLAANDYVMGTGFPLFLEHLETCSENERARIKTALADKERLDSEMMTIEKAKSAFESGKTVLVIKDDGKYLVKMGDKIDMFDDNTLPDWMRSKLGMLKLVQAEQFVSDTGCRVNDETFVLIAEES